MHIIHILLFIFFLSDEGTLRLNDINFPFRLNTRIDSLVAVFGPAKEVKSIIQYAGRGPKLDIHNNVIGEESFYDSLIIYSMDSLIVAMNGHTIQYYVFTSKILQTFRGGHIGSTKQEILKLYGVPTDIDKAYDFAEALSGEEDETLRYVCSESYPDGIEFFFIQGRVSRIYIGRGGAC